MSQLYITILAGGIGKRMYSDIPKVLHRIQDEAMIVRIIKQVLAFNPDKILIVVGQYKQQIQQEIIKTIDSNIIYYVDQLKPLGTGNAVKSTLKYFDGGHSIKNIILNGDVPMLTFGTIKKIYDYSIKHQSKLLITSISSSNPTGSGRIILDANGIFQEIIEERDCSETQREISLINVGIYICDSDVLLDIVPQISNNNAQGEYYLTDLVKIYRENSDKNVDLYMLDSDQEMEIFNVNTREQLDSVIKYLKV